MRTWVSPSKHSEVMANRAGRWHQRSRDALLPSSQTKRENLRDDITRSRAGPLGGTEACDAETRTRPDTAATRSGQKAEPMFPRRTIVPPQLEPTMANTRLGGR